LAWQKKLMIIRRQALDTLLHALEEPSSCFVLGAGASAPLVPFGGQLRASVAQRVLSVGVFSARHIPQTEISERILGYVPQHFMGYDGRRSISEELLAHYVSPAAVEAATIEALGPDPLEEVPSQYAVFNISRHRLTILNYNSDGFASHYCPTHDVVNVHGTSPSAAVRSALNWEKKIDILQEFPELPAIVIPGLLLPQREQGVLAFSDEYATVRRALKSVQRLVLVGYSFGEMDDAVAYETIIRVIRRGGIAATVLKPDAAELAGQMAHDSSSDTVLPLQAYWHCMSAAILAARCQPHFKTCNHERLCARCVLYLYEGFVDKQ
jgi:hypothetical protein